MKLNITSMTSMVHHFLANRLKEGCRVIDGTTGNGHDTLFLARLVGPSGRVYGFDIQEKAIINTEKRLSEHNLLERVELHKLSNDRLLEIVKEEIDGAVYNLGYLPGGDHSIITTAETTVSSIKQALSLLKPRGLIAIVAYIYHPGGREESEALQEYLTALDENQYVVNMYSCLNSRRPCPLIYFISKR